MLRYMGSQRVRHDLATEQQEKETDLDLIVVRGINLGLPSW